MTARRFSQGTQGRKSPLAAGQKPTGIDAGAGTRVFGPRLWPGRCGKVVGRENPCGCTHGGAPGIVEVAAGGRLIHLPRITLDGTFDQRRFGFLNACARYLVTQDDGLFAGDVDDLLSVDPAPGVALAEFAGSHRHADPALRAANKTAASGWSCSGSPNGAPVSTP